MSDRMGFPELTPEQEQEVWEAIWRAEQPDDRSPEEVIQDSYGGDRHRYLAVMAVFLDVRLEAALRP